MAGQRNVLISGLAAVAVGAAVASVAALSGGGQAAVSLDGSSAPRVTSAATITAPRRTPPATPPAEICGNGPVLSGPATQPRGSVRVPAGSNQNFNFGDAGTTYWFARGIHTLGRGQYANIDPSSGATFIGAPGAILDGQHLNNSAFDDTAAHVTISYLTIRNFGAWGGDGQEGVVNHDSGSYWTITHSTIAGNAGAGVMVGSHDVLAYDCIADNQQYGFNAYSNSGVVTGITLDHNQISGNDTYNYEVRQPGCGCSGGGKFWDVNGAIVTNNWVYDNNSVGLWADTDNSGFEFVGNYISDNQDNGIIYEISYNALIEYNTFERNAIRGGPLSLGFPDSAIYISESGSDSRVNTSYKNTFLIAHNKFVNNWSGVILWENANRFCNSPDNTSTGYCTLVDPKVVNLRTCGAAKIARQPYFSDCRWKTQNVLVEDNVFDFDPAAIGKACTIANSCGFQGVFSEYGGNDGVRWNPYQGDIVPNHITFSQDNHFISNTYVGPWRFFIWQLGTQVSWSQWRGSRYREDKGSTLTS